MLDHGTRMGPEAHDIVADGPLDLRRGAAFPRPAVSCPPAHSHADKVVGPGDAQLRSLPHRSSPVAHGVGRAAVPRSAAGVEAASGIRALLDEQREVLLN
ncbi:hypothetical protein GCM10020295_77970 [Streptomyces cinereospinus]